MSTPEENKRLARRFYKEPLEERRSSVLDELLTDDYVDADAESSEERVPGPEGVKRVSDPAMTHGHSTGRSQTTPHV